MMAAMDAKLLSIDYRDSQHSAIELMSGVRRRGCQFQTGLYPF